MSIASYIELSRELYRNRVVSLRPFRQRTPLLHFPKEAADALRREGVYMVKDYFSPDECREVINAIDTLWKNIPAETVTAIHDKCVNGGEEYKRGVEQEQGYKLWIDRHYSDHRIIGAEKVHPLIARFYDDEKCMNLGRHHLGTQLKMQFTMANKLVYKVENTGSGGGWHRDNCYINGFKSMIYLDDVGADDGPFQYIPASHQLSAHFFMTGTPHKYQFTHEEITRMAEKKKLELKSVTAPKGSLLLFDTNILHRGKPISEGHSRYALTNYYHYK